MARKLKRKGSSEIRSILDECDPEISSPSDIQNKKSSFTIQKATFDQLKRVSASVHLWAIHHRGSVNFLYENDLSNEDYDEIVCRYGINSKLKLLDEIFSPSLVKSIWINSSGDRRPFCSFRKDGFYHNAATLCPFSHCNTSVFGDLDRDLMHFTPSKLPSTQGDVEGHKDIRKCLLVDFEKEEDISESENTESSNSDDVISAVPEAKTTKELDAVTESVAAIESDAATKSATISQSDTMPEAATTAWSPKNDYIDPVSVVEVCVEEEVQSNVRSSDVNFPCTECDASFRSFHGLENHFKIHNSGDSKKKPEKVKRECPYCKISVIRLDVHIRSKHELFKTCPVCLKKDITDIREHRSKCYTCPICKKYSNKKLEYILNHVNKCRKNIQSEPMDLSSPVKGIDKREELLYSSPMKEKFMKQSTEDTSVDKIATVDITDVSSYPEKKRRKKEIECSSKGGSSESAISIVSKHSKQVVKAPDDLIVPRTDPYDDKDEEGYISEHSIDDTVEETRKRRRIKDDLELELRGAESDDYSDLEEEDAFVNKFYLFCQKSAEPNDSDLKTNKVHYKQTLKESERVLRHGILKAFQNICVPFKPSWLLDCISVKNVKINGHERTNVKETEPLYLTSMVLEEAYRIYGHSGNKEKKILGTVKKLKEFLVYEASKTTMTDGLENLEKMQSWHHVLDNYIKNTGKWKTAKDDIQSIYEDNLTIKDIQNPTRNKEVLEQFSDWLETDARKIRMEKHMKDAADETFIPDASYMDTASMYVLEEVIVCSGCRPVVLERFPMKAWTDGTPGFNPDDTSEGDRKVREVNGDDKIYQRINPLVPRKEYACEHQLRDNSATCVEHCAMECKPDGFNYKVSACNIIL